MDFFKDLLKNLGLLLLIGLIIIMLSPGWMGQLIHLFGTMLGPIAILMLIMLVIPKGNRRHR